MRYSFVTSCVSADGEEICETQLLETQLADAYFINRIALAAGIKNDILDMLGYTEWAKSNHESAANLFANDFCLSCHRSFYQGIPCLYVRHSAIEYIFIPNKYSHLIIDNNQTRSRNTMKDNLEQSLDDFFDAVNITSYNPKKAMIDFFEHNKEKIINNRIPVHGFIADNDLAKLARKLYIDNFNLAHS